MLEVKCAICNEPVVLEQDRYADENGQVVHEHCYISRLVAAPNDPPTPQHTE
mgnify:CR=1 FL=1